MRERFGRLKALPVFTFLLVGINVVLFLMGDLGMTKVYSAGMLSVGDVLYRKEYGRILWSMFLHEGMEHLFNNMVLLLFLGGMLEEKIGHLPYTGIYLLSGVAGNLLSLWDRFMNASPNYSLGASGAVFGLDGLFLALLLFSHKKIPTVTVKRLIFMIVLSLYNGYRAVNVDNMAHVGGLIAGFLLGILWCVIRHRKEGKE